jgi:hypothetical protein
MKGWILAAAGSLLALPGCSSPVGLRHLFGQPPVPSRDYGPRLGLTPPPAAVAAAEADPPEEQGFLPLLDRRDLYSAGVRGWRNLGSSDGPAGSNRAAAARFEWTRMEPDAGRKDLPVHGVLVEAVVGTEESGNRETLTRALEAGVWWTTGTIRGARGDPDGALDGYRSRSDAYLGFRIVRVRERDEDRDSLLHDDRDGYSLPEFSVGLRQEFSPCRGVLFFARGDVGVLPLIVVNSFSYHYLVGLRLEPVRGVGVELGWEGLGSAGGRLFSSVSFRWDGPWIGLGIEF